jgi:hypothetical protein
MFHAEDHPPGQRSFNIAIEAMMNILYQQQLDTRQPHRALLFASAATPLRQGTDIVFLP